MTDIVNSETRSRMMSRIRSKDTSPELALRRALHARGFRYRLHSRRVVGRPDLILYRHSAVVFVHGCFWHRHEGCRFTTFPSTRPDFWQAKFDANVRRDREVRALLAKEGWRVATIWECSLRRPKQVAITVDLIAAWLPADTPTIEIGEWNAPDGTAVIGRPLLRSERGSGAAIRPNPVP